MKKLLFLLFFACFFSLAFAANEGDYYYLLKVQSDYSFTPAIIYPGDTVAINVNIENQGLRTIANDTNVSIILPEYFEPIKSQEIIGDFPPSSVKTAVFRIKVKDTAYSGAYKIPIIFSYYRRGELISDKDTINLPVSSNERIEIQNPSINFDYPHIGDTIKISADIKNSGSIEARSVTVKLIPITAKNFANFIILSDTSANIGSILPTESKKVDFLLKATSSTAPQVYTFDLNAQTLGGYSTTETISFDLKGKPSIIISGINFSIEARPKDTRIMQGDNFSISIQMDNIGEEKAKAVEARIDSDEGIIGIKKQFVGNIDEDDSGAAIFDLSAKSNATAGVHNATVVISFINELGFKEEISQNIELYVYEKPPTDIASVLFLLIILVIAAYFLVRLLSKQKLIPKNLFSKKI